MAEKKRVPSKKGVAAKKKKPAAKRAPGKADPGFLTKLTKAVREEYLAAASGDPRTEAAAADGSLRAAPAAESIDGPAPVSARGATPEKRSASGAKRPASAGSRRKALLKELEVLLDELDEEGLDFLLEQAHVHRYNMEVERLNEAEERREALRKDGKAGSRPGRRAPAPRAPDLRIERSKDGNTYHVVFAGRYKMFSAEEMLALVRIAHANPEPAEAGRGLYRWLSRERTDALADLGFSGPGDPVLAGLADLLRTSFAKPRRD